MAAKSATSEETGWGVKHEGGRVTVAPAGQASWSQYVAVREAIRLDVACEVCEGHEHQPVPRGVKVGTWQNPPELEAPGRMNP